MRVISKKTKYALRALYALSRHFGEGPMLISRLSSEEAIPKKFLEIILLNLKNGGIVASKTGKGGGYHLLKSPAEVTVGAVIRMMEGPLAPLPCASETAYRACEECIDAELCETRLVMRDVRNATSNVLDNTTLEAACRRVDQLREKASASQTEAVPKASQAGSVVLRQ
jgi:Rrf2 family protein